MISAITWQLLAVLLAAALLGLLIGLCSMRLHQAQQEKEAYNSNKAALDKLSADRDDLNSEKAGIMQALESEKKSRGMARDKHTQMTAQQETLQVHAGLQAQQITQLNAELHSSEEKCIRLQRDFASFKANKLREVRMLKANTDEWLDNEELPVLNKKVELSNRGATALESTLGAALQSSFDVKKAKKNSHSESDDAVPDSDQTQPIIASELDIPSLAESELPDSVDALDFGLVDVEERN